MNPYAKIAWWLAIIYTIGAMGLFVSSLGQGGLGEALISILVLFHLALFVIFFLAYKMRFRFFAFLSAAWFCFGFVKLLGKIVSLDLRYLNGDSFWFSMGGALTALVFMAAMVYLSLKVVLTKQHSISS